MKVSLLVILVIKEQMASGCAIINTAYNVCDREAEVRYLNLNGYYIREENAYCRELYYRL